MRNRYWTVLLAVVVAAGVTGCRGGEAEADGAASEAVLVLQPADVALVEERPLTAGVLLTGTLNPFRIVEVRAQVPGVVSRMAVDRGDAVRAGQLLAVIEAEGIRSAAAGAQAQVVAARAALSVAQQRLESSRKLFERGAISEIDLKTAQAGYEAAEGQLAAARAQAASAGESARRATVTSPIAGEVSARPVSAGEAVSPGDPILTVVNSTQLELAGQIPVQQAANVQPGQAVEFTLDAYPGQTFEGTVARVDPTADPATRQVGVYLRLPNAGRRIVGGLFASGRVLTGAVDTVLSVPESAVRTEGEASFVYAVAQDRLVRRAVVLGTQDPASGRVQVISGVNAGERVLVAPGVVADNARIRFETPAAPAAVREE
jgi:RND family efflux transporter MFP subunit